VQADDRPNDVPRRLFALRGATTVEADSPEQIDERTQEMMSLLMSRNGLAADDLISILFSCTHDLVSKNPATATRAMGLTDVPLLGVQEASMAGALPLCIRVMLHIETTRTRAELRHVFLRGAKVLRPDLVEAGDA
jgi:chorismate mutase